MASQRTKFTVGLFMAGGIAIALSAIIWLGTSHFLQKGQYYVTYFNESVQGLNIDSPVKYRGVCIGRVESIGVAPDATLIQVVVKIESGQTLDSDIVAELKSVGITGRVFIELDRKKKGEPDCSPPLGFPSKYPIVASKPSKISELLRGLDEVLNQIQSIDLHGMSEKANDTLDKINRTIADANVKGISTTIESSLESANSILNDKRWENIMASAEKVGQSLNSLMGNADRNLDRAGKTLAQVERIIAENVTVIKTAIKDFRQTMKTATCFLQKGSSLASETDATLSYLSRHMLVTSQNLERASENLDRLIELLAEQPSQLLFGEPPLPRSIEPES